MDEYELSGYGEEIEELGWDDEDDDDIGDEIDDLLDIMSGEEDDDFDDDDIDALVGAKRRRRRRPRRRRRRRRPRGILRRVRPRQWRKYPLGLGVTNIGAGATAVITVNPQLPFKLSRLSTPTAGMTIDNIQIGTVSQFVAAGAVPTEVFGPTATGIGLKGDTAVPGVAIQLTVTNPGAAAADFSGALLGLVAQ